MTIYGCKRQRDEAKKPSSVVDYVNPLMGTGGLGFGVGSVLPGPLVPFGMVKLGPDTSQNGGAPGFSHCGGYWYKDDEIRGYSINHLSGTGVPDYGNLRVSALTTLPEKNPLNNSSHTTTFEHKNEVAQVGYYRVLQDNQIEVELAATAHCGIERFTNKKKGNLYILLDVSSSVHPDDVVDTYVDIFKGSLSGWLKHKGPMTDSGYTLYFFVDFDRKPVDLSAIEDNKYVEKKHVEGDKTGVIARFDNGSVTEKICISYIDLNHAKRHYQSEIEDKEIEDILESTKSRWETLLSRIDIDSDESTKSMFYTSLYRALSMPTDITESGDEYMGFDGRVHNIAGHHFYTDMSLWDTFRTLHPLYVILYPEFQLDMIISLIRMAEQTGELPKWPAALGDSGSMVGTSADIVIADSYIKGIKDFDAKEALKFMIKTANDEHGKRAEGVVCNQFGYCPSDLMDGSVSKTLEFEYDDFAIATLADATGDYETASEFQKRTENYKNLWDKETAFLRPKKSDGSWVDPFDPIQFSKHYVEGDAWQYTFYVPYDPDGLIELFGTKDIFVDKLVTFFENSDLVQKEGVDDEDYMPDPYYWHGNEPDLHSAFLFAYAGRCDLTSFWTKKIIEEKYAPTPDGLSGNDDGGTLSSWLVFAISGLYPIAATKDYIIVEPVARRVVFHLKDHDLIITKVVDENIDIPSIEVDGKSLDGCIIDHDSLIEAGRITYLSPK